MISYGSIQARLTVLNKKHNFLDAEWQKIQDLPDDVEENYRRKLEVMMALKVSQGRILECQVWLEWGEKFPDIERPDQLPTERNTLRHDAVPDVKTEKQAKREREDLHRGNAEQLASAISDLA